MTRKINVNKDPKDVPAFPKEAEFDVPAALKKILDKQSELIAKVDALREEIGDIGVLT